MLNNVDFINRLKQIMTHYNLSAAAFADKIAVQRSGISHILSGRNKPSLDFVLKVTHYFTAVDLYWLLYGEGDFPKKTQSSSPSLFDKVPQVKQDRTPVKKIQQIIVFYNDHTFEEFNTTS